MTALEKWKNDFKEFISELSIPRDDYKGIMEYINEVPNEALEQQPCEDAISRQVVLEGIASIAKAKARSDAQKSLMGRVMFFTEQLPSVTPQPCEDAISRQAVINVINQNCIFENEYNLTASRIKEKVQQMPSVTPKEKTGYCKDCKWWKDNDGVYRRGVGAESKCPINRKEVYEGNGYCFMFEPQESEDKVGDTDGKDADNG